jgi:Catalytic LigB subunit of aromatic ring-opening dioxygenase
MGELLGIGLSHYPPLCSLDGDMAAPLRSTLRDPAIPPDRKDPANWPEPMQAEWRDERAAAATHRAALVDGFTRCRAAIDTFAPDAVLVVGDDQYENFREDLIPPFAVLAYDDLIARPWAHAQASSAMDGKPNTWGEPADFEFAVRMHRDIALTLVTGLLERSIDVAYAYRPLHHQSLSHAFMNTLLFLDYDRRGFSHPIVPFAVNCYGRSVISRRGFLARFGEEGDPDPPSPSPARMMEVGRAIADVVRANPWRIALVASSSWSHAFLCDKTWRLMPDIKADRRLYELMQAGDYHAIAELTLPELEEAGQQELLTWFVLFGAMKRMVRTPQWSTMVETYVFNSNKVFATF